MTNLLDKVSQFKTDADLFHQVIMGDRTTVVTTNGGPVSSLSKWQADRETEVGDAINTIQASLLSVIASPPGRYTFTASAGQTEWTPPGGITFLPGMPWVFVNGSQWNRTESWDDSTGSKITFVRPLTMGYSVTVFIPASVTFPITGVSALDLATAASGKGADMIGFIGANSLATTVSALGSSASNKGANLVAYGSNTLAQVIDPANQSDAAVLDGTEQSVIKQAGVFVRMSLASLRAFVINAIQSAPIGASQISPPLHPIAFTGLNAPTAFVRTSGGSGAYTPPVGTRYLRLRGKAPGGGGAGSGTSPGAGQNAGYTTFDPSGASAGSYMSLQGGSGGSTNFGGNGQGVYSIGSSTSPYLPVNGTEFFQLGEWGLSTQNVASPLQTGGHGGGSGGGMGGAPGANGNNAKKAGCGGGGAGQAATGLAGAGGQEGAYGERTVVIPDPNNPPTFNWAVGSGGSGGTAGTGGNAGGAGLDGYLIVEAY